MLGWPAADDVDWTRLFHAYGPAVDTPGHLRALTGDDLAAADGGLEELSLSVVHQFSVYPVTPFAVRILGGILDDPALRREAGDGVPLLVGVLAILDSAAHTSASHEGPMTTELTWPTVGTTADEVRDYFDALESGDFSTCQGNALEPLWTWSMVDLLDACGELVDAVTPLTVDEDDAVRLAALEVLTRLGRVPTLVGRKQELVSLFVERLGKATARDERAMLVVGIGDLQGDTGPWLLDDDVAVRACAAMSRHDDAAATTVLRTVLLDLGAVNGWFKISPWPFTGTRDALLGELLSRGLPFADLLPVALAVARDPNISFSERDWGGLLLRAFPDVVFEPGVQLPPPTSLDPSQRAFLEALLENDDLWERRRGSHTALMRVGIPQKRKQLARLLRRVR